MKNILLTCIAAVTLSVGANLLLNECSTRTPDMCGLGTSYSFNR